jgi:hypothetical protein
MHKMPEGARLFQEETSRLAPFGLSRFGPPFGPARHVDLWRVGHLIGVDFTGFAVTRPREAGGEADFTS